MEERDRRSGRLEGESRFVLRRERWKKGKGKMEKGEGKSGEVGGEEENLGEKLRREVVVGKKGGPCTPVPSWRLWAPKESIIDQKPFPNSVSARKLGAALWEFQHYLSLSKMNGGFSTGVTGADSSLRRHRRRPSHRDNGLDLSRFPGHAHASSTSADQPGSASSLQKHIASLLMEHRRSNEGIKQKTKHALQHESPTICSSSMEVTPYDPGVIPTSPLRAKGRIVESQRGIKTSTELLKVLNRIWSLEEQHMANISLIKALKAELDHARANIKNLLQQRSAERGQIDDLIKQFAEEKLVRKNKEQKRIEAAIKSATDEIEDERRLRKQSETLHSKLARDLSKVKLSLSNALKDLEMEKKSRILLEDLCDEFARGIKDYDQDLHALKQKTDKNCVGRNDHDRLILHISESWLDERMQMQKDGQSIRAEKSSIVEKLYLEIESFLQDKHVDADKIRGNLLPRDRRNSQESIHFNELTSAPHVAGGKEDYVGCDSRCLELHKPSFHNLTPNRNETVDGHVDGTKKFNDSKLHIRSRGRTKSRTPSSLQVRFEEQMAWAVSQSGNKNSSVINPDVELAEKNLTETVASHKSEEHGEGAYGGDSEGKITGDNEIHELVLNKMVDDDDRSNEQMVVGGGSVHPQSNYGEASCSSSGWRNQASPIRQWELKTPEEDVSKENTLKAKLLEARSRGHRSRLKVFKGLS